jgi:hypothetical protein
MCKVPGTILDMEKVLNKKIEVRVSGKIKSMGYCLGSTVWRKATEVLSHDEGHVGKQKVREENEKRWGVSKSIWLTC